MTPEQLQSAVTQFIANSRLKAQGGLTVAEFGQLTVDLLTLAVSGLDGVSTLDGPSKKAWAIACVGLLFDAVSSAAIPVAMWPVWLVLRPAVRSLVLAAAGGALEKILVLTRAAVLPAPAPEPLPVPE